MRIQRGIDPEAPKVGLHLVGAVADDVLRLEGLLLAPLLDRAAMDREHGIEGDQFGEVGHGLGELDDEDGWSVDPKPQQRLVRRVGLVGSGAAHKAEEADVVGRHLVFEDAAPRVVEVGGGEWVAVRPAGVWAEVEGVGAAIGGEVEPFGDARFGRSVIGGRRKEAFEELVGDIALHRTRHGAGVEGLRVGAEREGKGVGGTLGLLYTTGGGEHRNDAAEQQREAAEALRGSGHRHPKRELNVCEIRAHPSMRRLRFDLTLGKGTACWVA